MKMKRGLPCIPGWRRGWAKRGVRLRIPTNSQHRKRLNIFGWVAPLLGRLGLIKLMVTEKDFWIVSETFTASLGRIPYGCMLTRQDGIWGKR
ncbi:MAG: hypothetical protein V2A69_16475 [Pseudomonadota bacterium]